MILYAKYPDAPYSIHQPLGARLLREGISKLIEIHLEGVTRVVQVMRKKQLGHDEINSIVYDTFITALRKEAKCEEWHTYYAAYNLFRTLAPKEYEPDYHFVVLAELALMSDYVVTNWDTMTKLLNRYTHTYLWSKDVSPGTVFIDLLKALKKAEPRIKPINVSTPGDGLRFGNEVARAAGIRGFAELTEAAVAFTSKWEFLASRNDEDPIIEAAVKCAELRQEWVDPLFLVLRSGRVLDVIRKIPPPFEFENIRSLSGKYDWATSDILLQLYYMGRIHCRLASEGPKTLCHVLAEKGRCQSGVPHEIPYGEEDNYHDDCYYFAALRALRKHGVASIRSL